MSRRRISPFEWFDEGPQSAHVTLPGGYSPRPALTVGSMVPILRHGSELTDHRTRRREIQARWRAKQT